MSRVKCRETAQQESVLQLNRTHEKKKPPVFNRRGLGTTRRRRLARDQLLPVPPAGVVPPGVNVEPPLDVVVPPGVNVEPLPDEVLPPGVEVEPPPFCECCPSPRSP